MAFSDGLNSPSARHSHDREHENAWHVRRCPCGQLTVQLGPVRIDLSRAEFAQLHRLLDEAMLDLNLAPSAAPVTRFRPS